MITLRGWVLVLTVVAMAYGCLGEQTAELRVAQLMPQPIAKRIVARYLGQSWADRPYLHQAGNCPKAIAYVDYSEINSVVYDSFINILHIGRDRTPSKRGGWMLCPSIDVYAGISIKVSPADAKELAEALASLGAQLPTQ